MSTSVHGSLVPGWGLNVTVVSSSSHHTVPATKNCEPAWTLPVLLLSGSLLLVLLQIPKQDGRAAGIWEGQEMASTYYTIYF